MKLPLPINDPLVAKIFAALKEDPATLSEKAEAIDRANRLLGVYDVHHDPESLLADLLMPSDSVSKPS